MDTVIQAIGNLFTGATFTILTLLSSLNSCVNPWIYLAFNRELVRLLKQQLTCRGRETSSYRGASGGSGSSTGTPGDTGVYKRKSFSKHGNSVVVTKTTFIEDNSCRGVPSSGSRCSVDTIRERRSSGQRRISQLANSLFVRNSALSVAASTCCRAESEDSDVHKNTFRYDTAGPYRGLNRAGAIRKKSNIEASNIQPGFESVANERKYYSYSLTPKKEGNSLSGSRIIKIGDPAKVGVTNQVMALLHNEPEVGRRMQVQF